MIHNLKKDLLPETREMDKTYIAQDFHGRQPVINHIHWDGSIPPETLFKFYERKKQQLNRCERKNQQLKLPEKDIHGNSAAYSSEEEKLIDSPEKLAQFQQGLLTKWDIIDVFKVPIGAMKSDHDLISMAAAHCEYLQLQGVKYAETRFAPSYHLNPKGRLFTLDDVIKNALLGFQLGEERTGVKTELIICINREIDQNYLIGKSLVNSIDVVKAAIAFSDTEITGNKLTGNRLKKGVIGIDLACYEPCAPPDDFLSAYRLTFDTPLKRTVHAGEMMGSDEANLRNIRYAVEHLRPDGLGHAIPLHKDRELVEIVAKRGIRIESNPRSNLHCGFIKDVKELGLDVLVENGVKVTINPDDPMMWPEGHLADNLALAANAYGVGIVDQMIRNSVETAWGLTEAEKKFLLLS